MARPKYLGVVEARALAHLLSGAEGRGGIEKRTYENLEAKGLVHKTGDSYALTPRGNYEAQRPRVQLLIRVVKYEELEVCGMDSRSYAHRLQQEGFVTTTGGQIRKPLIVRPTESGRQFVTALGEVLTP